MSESLIFIGMDVHQDTVTLAVFEGASKEAAVVKKLSSDLRKLRRFFDLNRPGSTGDKFA